MLLYRCKAKANDETGDETMTIIKIEANEYDLIDADGTILWQGTKAECRAAASDYRKAAKAAELYDALVAAGVDLEAIDGATADEMGYATLKRLAALKGVA